MEAKIKNVFARQILDSRGNPTVEVEVELESGVIGRAAVPSGASTGSYEAVELRDGDKNCYLGKSVKNAVKNVNTEIKNALMGQNAFEQEKIDNLLCKLDGTPNKARLGANAILGTSLAVAKASSIQKNIPLFKYIGNDAYVLPVPMMNVLNGGKHADNSLNIQEFMIIPVGAKNFENALEMCATVFHTLKSILKKNGYSTAVGDEGGFAPNFESDEMAFQFLVEAITQAGYKTQTDFCLGVDVASNEMFEEASKIGHNGKYLFWKNGKEYTANEMIEFWENMINKYPIISIEDALAEEDWDNWKILTEKLGNKVQLVGDDLFVTNQSRLEKGIKLGVANSILIKPNQIGTLTETIKTVKTAQQAGYKTVISHRSGETEDTFIADLSVALNAGQIKSGAPSRTDRVCKYNQLLRIEEKLENKAKYLGKQVFKK